MTTKHSALSVDDLVANPARVADVRIDDLPALLIKLTTLTAAVAARLQSPPQGKPDDDRLLDVAEAAAMLGRSPDWLYRHAKTLPFSRRLNGMVKFSRQGLQKYLAHLPRA